MDSSASLMGQAYGAARSNASVQCAIVRRAVPKPQFPVRRHPRDAFCLARRHPL